MQADIENTHQDSVAFKNVLLALAHEVFSNKAIPNYDKFNAMVTDVLAKSFSDVKCFSWTHSDPDRQKIAESMARLNVDISGLPIPKKIVAYARFSYPRVNETYFENAPGGSIGCSSPCKQM